MRLRHLLLGQVKDISAVQDFWYENLSRALAEMKLLGSQWSYMTLLEQCRALLASWR
jgi:hypothetical protein